MARIGDDFIIPDGETQRQPGIGLHLYAGGLRKFGVPLRIELQRTTEDGASPGNPLASGWRTIRVFEPGPQSFMDLVFLRRLADTQSQRNYYYRARHIACGLTPGPWSDVEEGIPEEFFEGYSLPPVPSYPKIHIEQSEVTNDPTKVNVALRATPEHSDVVIKYQVLDDTDPVPAKTDSSWSTYSGIFQVTRSDTVVKKIVAYGKLNRIIGNFYMQEVTTDRIPQVLTLTLSVDASGNVVAEITTDSDSGSVKVHELTTGYPTKSQVQTSGTCYNGRNITTGTLITLAPGETAYVSVLPYTQASCAGVEGELSRAKIEYTAQATNNAVLSARILGRGDINRMYVQLDSGALSYKYAIQTGSYAAEGTGTCQNETTGNVDVTSATNVYGTTYYVVITPYSAASCGGTQGRAFKFTFQRQWRDELLDDNTGWLKDSGILAQKKFENDAGAKLALSTAGVGAVEQPSGYAPSDDNERTFWDKENRHIPNQTDWGAGSINASIARYQFSAKYQTNPDAVYRKIFVLGDLVDGTFWNVSTGNGLWIEWGGTGDNEAKIYKRVAGVDTQLGGFMSVAESIVNDYIEFDIIIYEWNPVKFIVGLNGKFQVFADASNPNLSAGVYMGLMVHEDADPLFKNIFGRQEVGPMFAKKFVVGDLATAGVLDASREDVVVAGTAPYLRLYETDAPTNEKIWNLFADAGNLYLGQENDAESTNLRFFGVSNAAGIIQEAQLALSTTGTGALTLMQAPTGVSFFSVSPYPNRPLIISRFAGFYSSGAAANEKHWIAGMDSGDDFVIATITDAGGAGVTALEIIRGTGTAVTSVNVGADLLVDGAINCDAKTNGRLVLPVGADQWAT